MNAGDLTDEQVGALVQFQPLKAPAVLLTVEHGGPFTIPEHLPVPELPFPISRDVPTSMTVHVTVEHPDLTSPHPLHAWLTPGNSVTVTR